MSFLFQMLTPLVCGFLSDVFDGDVGSQLMGHHVQHVDLGGVGHVDVDEPAVHLFLSPCVAVGTLLPPYERIVLEAAAFELGDSFEAELA